MAGGLAIVGLLALLIAASEGIARLFARRRPGRGDAMTGIAGDVPAFPRPEPEVAFLRERGAL